MQGTDRGLSHLTTCLYHRVETLRMGIVSRFELRPGIICQVIDLKILYIYTKKGILGGDPLICLESEMKGFGLLLCVSFKCGTGPVSE